MSVSPSYELSHELRGHEAAVRALAVFKDGSVVSVSTDKTARIWRIGLDGKYSADSATIMIGHSEPVTSVCTIEPSTRNPRGFVVTGAKDSLICVYYPGESNPMQSFMAHEAAVTCLRSSIVETECFLSCSDDGSGKLWDLHNLAQARTTYAIHRLLESAQEQHASPTSTTSSPRSMRSIVDLANNVVAVGASDGSLLLHDRNSGNLLHHIPNAHCGSIRDLAVMTDQDLLSCGDDSLTKHWNTTRPGDGCLGTYSSNVGRVLGVTVTPGGGLAATCSDDRSVRIWRQGKMQQNLMMPGCVWCVRLINNEDIVTGTSDGSVRLFSVDKARQADRRLRMDFKQTVIESTRQLLSKLPQTKPVRVIPQANELNQPGEKDGDTLIVKENGSVKAYRWCQDQFQWKFVGDVIENEPTVNSRPGAKHMFNGVQYDYVFSVDIEQGAPLLKLPYNRGQDPYLAAMQFLEDNDLDARYLRRVANFITTNVQISPILNGEAQSVNPFAGGTRYVSSVADAQSAGTSRSSASSTSFETNYIPQTCYLKLEKGNISAICDKLREFNGNGEVGARSIPTDKLDSVMKLSGVENFGTIGDEVDCLKSLLNWPDNVVFPALDVARLAVLRKDVNKELCKNGIMDTLIKHIHKDAVAANQMLTFRLLANLFHHETGEKFCLQNKGDVLTMIQDFSEFQNKNTEVAVSTYILNLVVALNRVQDSPGKYQVLTAIFKLLEIFKDVEAIFRVFVGLGTLIEGTTDAREQSKFIKSCKRSRPVLKALRALLSGVDSSDVPEKLISVTRHILEVIKR